VGKLSDVEFDENAWAHLVLDTDTKVCPTEGVQFHDTESIFQLLIESLVRVTQSSNTTDNIISDVISGKGGGLVSARKGHMPRHPPEGGLADQRSSWSTWDRQDSHRRVHR
jgi:hypothetical protein